MKKNLTEKIVYSEFNNFINQLPNPADILLDKKDAIKTYKEMLLDEKIGSLWELRKNKVLDLPFYFKATENEKIDTLVLEHIEDKQIRKLSNFLLDAKIYGHRPVDITWELKDGYCIPEKIGCADIERFSYNKNCELTLRTNYKKDIVNQEYRWLVHRNDGSERDNPFGTSILNKVFWAWSFKKLGLEFWLQMEKKFSIPSFLTIFDTDEQDENKIKTMAKNIAEAVSNIINGSSGSLANIKEVVQVKAEGSVADFKILCDYCNEAISVGLTSQVLATGTTENGNRALGEVHNQSLDSMIKNDARALAYCIQELIKWWVELNFIDNKNVPIFEFDTKDKATFEQVIAAVQNKIPVSKKALYSQYKIPEPEDEDDVFIVETPQHQFFSDIEKTKKKSPLIILNKKKDML